MNQFVQLTLEGEPILVNVAQVMTVQPLEDGTRVSMAVHPGTFDVDEMFDAVRDLLTFVSEFGT